MDFYEQRAAAIQDELITTQARGAPQLDGVQPQALPHNDEPVVGTAIGNQPQPPAPLPAEQPPQLPKEILIAGETVRINILGVSQNDAYLVGGDSLGLRKGPKPTSGHIKEDLPITSGEH